MNNTARGLVKNLSPINKNKEASLPAFNSEK